MEIISTLQSLFAENGISSLAINLSLGISNRPSSTYDCKTPHRHKHTDALKEIEAWLEWLKVAGTKQVVLLGHSRGGNQTAWFAAEHDDPTIRKVILVAPQVWSTDYAAKDYEKRYGKPLKPLLDKAFSQASLRSRERFWDIRVPKIDSIFDNSLVPRPSWSPGVPPQHRKLVAATHRSPI